MTKKFYKSDFNLLIFFGILRFLTQTFRQNFVRTEHFLL